MNFIKEVQDGDEARKNNVKFQQDEMEGRAQKLKESLAERRFPPCCSCFLLISLILFDYLVVFLNLYFNPIAEMEINL